MYVGGAVRGPRLAGMLVNDLALLNALPVQVDRDGDWWIVKAGSDWLQSDGGEISTHPFFRIARHLNAGLYAIRAEVVLTALAVSVVTTAAGVTTWISGEQGAQELPAALRRGMNDTSVGRIVAFQIDREHGEGPSR